MFDFKKDEEDFFWWQKIDNKTLKPIGKPNGPFETPIEAILSAKEQLKIDHMIN